MRTGEQTTEEPAQHRQGCGNGVLAVEPASTGAAYATGPGGPPVRSRIRTDPPLV